MNLSPEVALSRKLRWPVFTRLLVVVSALLVLAAPLLYLAFLLGTAWALVAGALAAFERWALEPGWGWVNLGNTAALSAGLLTWVWFFRPFWIKPAKAGSALQVLPPDQPEWFETVAMAVVQARAPMPVEVRLDCGGGLRLDAAGAMGGAVGGRHRLTVGAAWIAVCSEGQLIADLVACLSQSPRGLAGRCYWVVRGMMEWLERASENGKGGCGAQGSGDDWEVVAGIRFPKRRRRGWWQQPGLVKIWNAYLWLTQRPVWFLRVLVRLAARPALRRVTFAGDAAAAQLLGAGAYAELLRRKAGMRGTDEAVARRLEGGIRDGRLPDNLVQLRIREMECGAAADATGMPDGAARLRRILKLGGEPLIASGGAAACLVRRFQEISRQLTQMYYQQDLGLSLSQFRLVAASETVKKTAEQDSSGFDIQRYFGGLVHPHRPLCGLEAEEQGSPSAEDMRRQIAASKRQMQTRGDQVRSVQREWVMAWQRCRDMEMAHALALAGMPLDARQYGLIAHEARLYREEIARQEIIMEHSDEALRSIEVDFERRLAAALGLLLSAPAEALTPDLRVAAGELPLWGVAYGALCDRLPVLWRMMNRVFAFEALGVEADDSSFKHADAGEESNALAQALDFLLPPIRQDLEHLLDGLECVPCPLRPEISVQDWLADGIILAPFAADGGLPSVADGKAAALVTERMMKLHQTIFAWLCRTAEAAEAVLGAEAAPMLERPASLARTGCETAEMGDIAACAAAAVT